MLNGEQAGKLVLPQGPDDKHKSTGPLITSLLKHAIVSPSSAISAFPTRRHSLTAPGWRYPPLGMANPIIEHQSRRGPCPHSQSLTNQRL